MYVFKQSHATWAHDDTPNRHGLSNKILSSMRKFIFELLVRVVQQIHKQYRLLLLSLIDKQYRPLLLFLIGGKSLLLKTASDTGL